MKKVLLITVLLLLPVLSYTDDEEIKEVFSTNCQWVFVALECRDLDLAKRQYYTVCNWPTYKGKEGYTWLSFAVHYEYLDQVEWALSLPKVNINDKFGGRTVLYITTLHIYKNNIQDMNHPSYKILNMLLDHGADPMYHNDTEGNAPYSNGESTYELILDINAENTAYGKLILQHIK